MDVSPLQPELPSDPTVLGMRSDFFLKELIQLGDDKWYG